jgi:hypothetical protein
MSERGRRIGLNEAVFREVNERIEDLADEYQLENGPLNIVCECGDPKCVQQIQLTRSDYERVRSDPTHFAVFPGHEVADVEDVVEKGKGYDVVRKKEGSPARIAEKTDPRNGTSSS